MPVGPIDAATNRVRLVFPGQVLLGFDRLTAETSDIRMGLWLPQPVSYAYPHCSWGTRWSAFTPGSQRFAPPYAAPGAIRAGNPAS